MKYLFKLTLKNTNEPWQKNRTVYIIEDTKEKAIDYFNSNKKKEFVVSNVCRLGFELSGIMFKGGKE